MNGRLGMKTQTANLGRVLQGLVIVPAFALVALAVWFQLSGIVAMVALVCIALVFLWICRCWWVGNRWAVWAWSGLVIMVVAVWYVTLQPSNDRVWAADVARGVTAEVAGDVVTVRDIRNFNWQTETDFTQSWETRTYRLSQMSSADVITSVWGNPAIAHVLVSFGFSDGQHLVFSAEIRREQSEVFSSVAGFFRRFELVLIAADERDIVRLRTDVRGETVSVFRLQATADQMRAMFLAYLDQGNTLSQTPEWYNTATDNCTTVIWQLVRKVSPEFPLDWRVLLSGYLPEFLYDQSLIRSDLPIAEVRARAVRKPLGIADSDGAAFSRRLRE